MKLKMFEDFLNESEEISPGFKRAVDVVIHFTLNQLWPEGGNNEFVGIEWEKLDPVFTKLAVPDLFINFDNNDAKGILNELKIVSKALTHRRGRVSRSAMSPEEKYVDEQFKENGLAIEVLDVDENIVYLYPFPIQDEKNFEELVTDFYRKRESRMEEIEKRWKTHFTSKKFGL